MSIILTKDVFCDFCIMWTYGCTSCSDTDARKSAKKLGWVRVKVEGSMKDICPECQKKREKEVKRG